MHGSIDQLTKALDCDGSNIEEKDKGGNTALIIAAMSGNQAMVKMLLDRGADTEARNHGGHTALMRASARGRFETCKILIDIGNADVHATDNNGDSVVQHAHLGHHEETERHLSAHIKKREIRLQEESKKAKEASGSAKDAEL